MAVTGKRNFILGIKSFHANPYDGHTLAQTVEEVEKNTGQSIADNFADLAYCGHNYKHKSKVYTPATRKAMTPRIKKTQKRRSAIEPVIGHLKCYGRLGCNYLKGAIGDIINPILCAIGFNLRQISRRLLASP